MIDLRASFCCQRCHIQCAFAVANDHNSLAVEQIQRCDITFREDPALELFLIEKLRQVLAIGVLSCGEQKKIKMFLLDAVLILIADQPAVCTFSCFQNFMIETYIELVMLYSFSQVPHHLLTSGVQIGLERPVKVG